VNGKQTILDFHRRLGKMIWDNVGIERNAKDLEQTIKDVRALREEFWSDVFIPGRADYYNKYLEFGLRVADFLELGELMAIDALDRNESAGCHLRTEYTTTEGEALRNDEDYAYVAAWGTKNVNGKLDVELVKEDLKFEFVELKQRSYK
jgi:succinate dehydrogenase / fumarate reductase flavoprotein subunit